LSNSKQEILDATRELLEKMVAANNIHSDCVTCVFFTSTPDLNAEFPAAAARQMGWTDVPLLGTQEIAVPNAPIKCLRILILFNTERQNSELIHVYLKGAEVLRQDVHG